MSMGDYRLLSLIRNDLFVKDMRIDYFSGYIVQGVDTAEQQTLVQTGLPRTSFV